MHARLALCAASLAALVLAAGAGSARQLTGTLYFAANTSGNYDVYSLPAGDATPIRLTRSARDEFDPAVSPDGERIAYATCKAKCYLYEFDPSGPLEATAIFVMNADGSGARQLTPWQSGAVHPSWSPDGGRIAYQSSKGDTGYHVWVMKADGSDAARVTASSEGYDQEPSWSPAGERIAFTRGGAVWILDLATGKAAPVLEGTNFSPAWSPDGSELAVSRDWGRYQHDIFVVSPKGSGLERITRGSGSKGYPAWSPDGSQIAFVAGPRAGSFANIQVVASRGGSTTMVRRSPGLQGWLAWH